MSQIYDLLVDQITFDRKVAQAVEEESMAAKPCTVCKKLVTDSDEYVLEVVSPSSIKLTHWKCYADKKRKQK